MRTWVPWTNDGGCVDSSHPDCEFRIMSGSVGHLAAFHRPEHTEEDRTARPILFRGVDATLYRPVELLPLRDGHADACAFGRRVVVGVILGDDGINEVETGGFRALLPQLHPLAVVPVIRPKQHDATPR